MASSSSSSNILLVICINVLVFYSVEARIKVKTKVGVSTTQNQLFPALIAFGDSILDTGNNNWLPTVVKCNFPPYGIDFPGHKATGRWGNGRVLSDFVAEGLGVKSIVPAFLDPALPNEELATGVCFAVGGSGVYPMTAQIQNIISILDQLENFKKYVTRLQGVVGMENAQAIVSNGLILISSGNNDLGITYANILVKSGIDVNAYTTKLVGLASDFLQKMYELGARKFAFLSTLPLGCLPAARSAGGVTRNCLAWLNNAGAMYNSKMETEINILNQKLTGAHIAMIDVFSPLLEVIQNAGKYGFADPSIACCASGTVEMSATCNRIDPAICPSTNSRVFFDGAHPSQRAYSIVAPSIVNQIVQHFSR